MKTLVLKMLGLHTLVATLTAIRKENEELKKSLAALEEKVDEIEIPDMDDYVSHSDLDDNIENYLNSNDYATQSYCDDEIESRVSDKVEEAIEEIDFEDKVQEVVRDMDKASFGDENELKELIKKVLEEMVKRLAEQK
jgi:BMFP domain-containing protein YqiC